MWGVGYTQNNTETLSGSHVTYDYQNTIQSDFSAQFLSLSMSVMEKHGLREPVGWGGALPAS